MKKFKEFIKEEKTAKQLTVTFKNSPSKMAPKYLFEHSEQLELIEEGKEKPWGDGYTYRLDKRPQNMGGNQIHIWDRDRKAWAYRADGERSEPNKYTSKATRTVLDIVSSIFNIDKKSIKEAYIVSASDEEMCIEVVFS
jgi:hypothetical protein